jgi:uncharacterized protein YbgA (DUF1722 family)
MAVNKTNKQLTHDEICDFVRKNFSEVKKNSSMHDLVHFHSINKFLFLAHNPNLTNQLGHLAANNKCLPVHIILEKYEEYLEKMLKMEPTTKSHANVLQKISGFFGNDLLAEQKLRMRQTISNYRLGLVDLESTLLILEVMTRKLQKTYLVRQTYFLLYCRVMLEGN